jgi:hypothetical protein
VAVPLASPPRLAGDVCGGLVVAVLLSRLSRLDGGFGPRLACCMAGGALDPGHSCLILIGGVKHARWDGAIILALWRVYTVFAQVV